MTNAKLWVGVVLCIAAGCSSAASNLTPDAQIGTGIDAPASPVIDAPSTTVIDSSASTTIDSSASTTVDSSASTTVDARGDVTIDAAVAGPDAHVVTSSTVWIAGDFVTDNAQQLGSFTFPLVASPVVPAIFAGATSNLNLINFSAPYSVSKDGTKIAYSQKVTGGDQLFIGNFAGGAPTLLFTANGASITDVALSPDGAHVAFRSDLVLVGMFDAYYLDTSTPIGAPAKMSPDRAVDSTALDATGFFSWSDDSRFVSFTGQFVAKNRFELHVFDGLNTTDAVAVPDSAIAAGTSQVGVLAPAQFDANDNVFYLAILDGQSQLIYSSTSDAAMQPQVFTPARSTNNVATATVISFALSPDRSTILFAEDATTQTAFEIYTADVSGTNGKTARTSGHSAGQSIYGFQPGNWNHTGTAFAFHADYGATPGKFQPYVLTINSGTLTRVATIGDDTDATRTSQGSIAWSFNDKTVFVISDAGTDNNVFGVSAQDVSTADASVAFLVTPPTNGDIFDVFTR